LECTYTNELANESFLGWFKVDACMALLIKLHAFHFAVNLLSQVSKLCELEN